MPLEGSYAVWNLRHDNEKSTLTERIAVGYCKSHPDQTILVIDMCPQAALSRRLLGLDDKGGNILDQLLTMAKDPIVFPPNQQRVPRTVSGFLDLYCSISGIPKGIDCRNFLLNISKLNPDASKLKIPCNLYLLAGDNALELIEKSLESRRASTNGVGGCLKWRTITLALRYFINKIAERKGIRLTAFVDAGCSLNACSEIALTAVNRLLIPVDVDRIQMHSIETMFNMLYGTCPISHYFYHYRHLTLHGKAEENCVKLPRVYLIIKHGRTTSLRLSSQSSQQSANVPATRASTGQLPLGNSIGASEAHTAATDDVCYDWQETVYNLYRKHPHCFDKSATPMPMRLETTPAATEHTSSQLDSKKSFLERYIAQANLKSIAGPGMTNGCDAFAKNMCSNFNATSSDPSFVELVKRL